MAVHQRLMGRGEQRLELDHYLELLHRKPGALAGATPLYQARQRGQWPETYQRLFCGLKQRHGDGEGARQMVEVLLLHREQAPCEVAHAVKMALEVGCFEAGAIRVLMRQLLGPQPEVQPLSELGELSLFGSPPQEDFSPYDQLLFGEVLA